MGRNDEGAAVVEFIFLSLLLLVPVVYLVFALGQVQSAAFAAEAVARDASRAAVVGGVTALQRGADSDVAERAARERAELAIATTLADFGIDAKDVDLNLACTESPCLAPGSDVTVAVTIRVALPVIGSLVPGATVTVSSSGSSPVDGYLP